MTPGLRDILAALLALANPAMAGPGAPLPETLPYLSVLEKSELSVLSDKGLHREVLGEVNLPTGRIVAMDPLTLSADKAGFVQTVPPGKYLATVYWTEDKDWGKRNAFAALQFSFEPILEWKIAVNTKQNYKALKDDEIFGYAVDGGMGSFLSPEAYQALEDSMDLAQKNTTNYSNYYDDVLSQPLEATNPSRLLYAPTTDPEKTIAMFASGFGDGYYPSYFGFDAQHRPVMLITTFFVVDGNQDPSQPADGSPKESKQ